MARINIDDSIHRDRRFHKLVTKLNGDRYKAIGLLVGAWTMAQDFMDNKETNGLVPLEEWNDEPFSEIVEVRLAEVRENHVYVKGSKDAFSWLMQKSEAGKKGGLKSAEARRKKSKQNEAGASSASSKVKRDKTDAGKCSSEKKPPILTPTPTLSPTPSIDLSINKNTGEILDFKNAQQKSMQEILENLKTKGITITPDQVIDLFNSKLAGVGTINHCRGLGSPSLLNMLDTFDKFPTLKDWEHLFDQVKKAKQITGEEPGVFVATLDWLSVRENALKADSGKYNLALKKSNTSHSTDYDLTEDDVDKLDKAGEL